MSDYLTTRELAELLRIKERKVYDLAAAGEVPVSRATGKLLFPRQAVEDWIAGRSSGGDVRRAATLPAILLGSHEPLLEWALRESRAGLATFLDGSVDGLRRFKAREGVASGLHLYDPHARDWNIPAIAADFAGAQVVLVEWAKRRRGFIVGETVRRKIDVPAQLKGLRLARRQAESGAQVLLEQLLGDAGVGPQDLAQAIEVRSELEAAMSVLEGKVDAAFGLEALAVQLRLAFVPIVEERFDLLVDRRAWFEPPLQALMAFTRGPAFAARAAEIAGYDVRELGRVHFNGA